MRLINNLSKMVKAISSQIASMKRFCPIYVFMTFKIFKLILRLDGAKHVKEIKFKVQL